MGDAGGFNVNSTEDTVRATDAANSLEPFGMNLGTSTGDTSIE